MTDPAEAAERVRARVAAMRDGVEYREALDRAQRRDGLRRAAEVVRARVDAVRMPCCRCALLEAAAVLDVLGLEPERGGGADPASQG